MRDDNPEDDYPSEYEATADKDGNPLDYEITDCVGGAVFVPDETQQYLEKIRSYNLPDAGNSGTH